MSQSLSVKDAKAALGAPAPTWALMGTTLHDSMAFADVLCKSGMLPRGLDTAAKVLVVLLKGRELGLPPLVATSQIAVIQGKPTAQSELLLALMLRAGIKHAWRTPEGNESQEAVLWLQRPDGTEHVERFTMDEAKVAGLLGKDAWRTYPTAMLRARCVSKAARAFCPDATMGISYTPEELGAEVTEDGEVVMLPFSPPPPKEPKPRQSRAVVVEAEVVEDEHGPIDDFLDAPPADKDDPLRAATSAELKALATAAEKVGALVPDRNDGRKKAVAVSDAASAECGLAAGVYKPSGMTVNQILKLTGHYRQLSLEAGGLGL
jgi:hypothetical protein